MTVGFMTDCSSTLTISTSINTSKPSISITSQIQAPAPSLNSTKNLENFSLLNEIEPIPSSCSSSTIAAIAAAAVTANDTQNAKTSIQTTPTPLGVQTKNSTTISTASSNITLGQLKKARAPKSGRNHAGAKYLASQYTTTKRIQEVLIIFICTPMFIYNAFNFVYYFQLAKCFIILFAAVVGILTADLFSGIVHWAADSYGSVDQFLIGKTILRNFREHHIDPTAITRHDFIETNGDNFAIISPLLVFLTYHFYTSTPEAIQDSYNFYLTIFMLCVFSSMTNQIHKWSHTYFGLPRYITILQDLHIIMPRIHHRIHHVTPHDTYFCITVGWLNYPLEQINFWQHMEDMVFKLTGVKPRTDDMKWALKTE